MFALMSMIKIELGVLFMVQLFAFYNASHSCRCIKSTHIKRYFQILCIQLIYRYLHTARVMRRHRRERARNERTRDRKMAIKTESDHKYTLYDTKFFMPFNNQSVCER
jgi:hypothetical protein